MIELAKEMKHLLLFAYVSTAYCHLEEKVSSFKVWEGRFKKKMRNYRCCGRF
jgi:hypothetical protein